MPINQGSSVEIIWQWQDGESDSRYYEGHMAAWPQGQIHEVNHVFNSADDFYVFVTISNNINSFNFTHHVRVYNPVSNMNRILNNDNKQILNNQGIVWFPVLVSQSICTCTLHNPVSSFNFSIFKYGCIIKVVCFIPPLVVKAVVDSRICHYQIVLVDSKSGYSYFFLFQGCQHHPDEQCPRPLPPRRSTHCLLVRKHRQHPDTCQCHVHVGRRARDQHTWPRTAWPWQHVDRHGVESRDAYVYWSRGVSIWVEKRREGRESA